MIRIASPESIWPRHFMNRLHKMNARAARCHSSNAANETKKDDKKPEETANPEGPQNFGPWNWSGRHGQRRHRDHGGSSSSSRPRSAFGASNFAGTGSMDDPVIADVDFSDLANLQANLHKHLSHHFGKHFGTPMTPPCGGQKAKEESTTTTEAAAEAAPEAAPEVAPEPAKEVKPEQATSTTPKEELSPRMKKVRDEMIKIHEQVHKMKIADDANMMEEPPVEEIEIPIKKAKTDDAEQVAIPMPWKEPKNLSEALEEQPSMEASAPLMEVEESQSQAKKSDVEEWTILDKSNSPTPDKEMPKTSTTTNPQGAEALYPKLDENTPKLRILKPKLRTKLICLNIV